MTFLRNTALRWPALLLLLRSRWHCAQRGFAKAKKAWRSDNRIADQALGRVNDYGFYDETLDGVDGLYDQLEALTQSVKSRSNLSWDDAHMAAAQTPEGKAIMKQIEELEEQLNSEYLALRKGVRDTEARAALSRQALNARQQKRNFEAGGAGALGALGGSYIDE